jgi:hypothetical protein
MTSSAVRASAAEAMNRPMNWQLPNNPSPTKERSMAFDPKCYELADYFMDADTSSAGVTNWRSASRMRWKVGSRNRNVPCRLSELNPPVEERAMLLIQSDDMNPFDEDEKFQEWVRQLDEDVIQAEYGYERGEFTVTPTLWHPLYAEGLTPAEAFKRALAAHVAR